MHSPSRVRQRDIVPGIVDLAKQPAAGQLEDAVFTAEGQMTEKDLVGPPGVRGRSRGRRHCQLRTLILGPAARLEASTPGEGVDTCVYTANGSWLQPQPVDERGGFA